MNTVPATQQDNAAIIEQVVIGGDLSKLTPAQRVSYYRQVCESLGLNPLTKPFAYLNLSSKLVLYAQRDATDQMRRIHGVSIKLTESKTVEGVYVVGALATNKEGRTDEATGAVSTGSLKGEMLANAMMRAETKAKRRVTLSICGLGWMDETEVETVREARPVPVDPETGEIRATGNGKPTPEPSYVASYVAWVRKARAEIEALTQPDAVHEWQARNQKALNKLAEVSPADQTALSALLARRWSALSGAPQEDSPMADLPI